MTKLILTHEVTKLGEPGDVVDVKDGYARNYLLPRNFAIRWTRGAEKQVSSIQRGREVRDVRDLGQAGEVKGKLESLSIKLPVRAGETGRLFGAVTVSDIVEAVAKAGGPAVDKRRIEIGQPIKTVGAHQVTVRVHPEVTAEVRLNVVAGK
jgi:large subunit ribosomal protein L9